MGIKVKPNITYCPTCRVEHYYTGTCKSTVRSNLYCTKPGCVHYYFHKKRVVIQLPDCLKAATEIEVNAYLQSHKCRKCGSNLRVHIGHCGTRLLPLFENCTMCRQTGKKIEPCGTCRTEGTYNGGQCPTCKGKCWVVHPCGVCEGRKVVKVRYKR